MIERRGQKTFNSQWGGAWTAIAFYNRATGEETMALVKGAIDPSKPTLVRMHMLSIFPDVFGETGERDALVRRAMEVIGEEGSGVLVMLNRPSADYASRAMQGSASQASAEDSDETPVQRDYGGGAQILAELGIREMMLLTNTHHALAALEGYGLSIVGERPID